jgi:hypothetical protein
VCFPLIAFQYTPYVRHYTQVSMHVMETMWTLVRITVSSVPCNAIGLAFWSVYDVGPGTVSGTSKTNSMNAVVE